MAVKRGDALDVHVMPATAVTRAGRWRVPRPIFTGVSHINKTGSDLAPPRAPTSGRPGGSAGHR